MLCFIDLISSYLLPFHPLSPLSPVLPFFTPCSCNLQFRYVRGCGCEARRTPTRKRHIQEFCGQQPSVGEHTYPLLFSFKLVGAVTTKVRSLGPVHSAENTFPYIYDCNHSVSSRLINHYIFINYFLSYPFLSIEIHSWSGHRCVGEIRGSKIPEAQSANVPNSR